MKTLVIGITGISSEMWSNNKDDERLENFNRLAEFGCYGGLEPDQDFTRSIGDQDFGKRFAPEAEVIYLTSHTYAVASNHQEITSNLNGELGRILEILDDDTALLILIEYAQDEKIEAVFSRDFILAFPNSPLQGEMTGTTLADLSATLFDLREKAVPVDLSGKSLLEGLSWKVNDSPQPGDGLSSEEEELLRERLSGLGYIG